MTKSNIHKALGAAALLGMVLLTGCQDVSTDLKPPKYKTSIPENATSPSRVRPMPGMRLTFSFHNNKGPAYAGPLLL